MSWPNYDYQGEELCGTCAGIAGDCGCCIYTVPSRAFVDEALVEDVLEEPSLVVLKPRELALPAGTYTVRDLLATAYAERLQALWDALDVGEQRRWIDKDEHFSRKGAL